MRVEKTSWIAAFGCGSMYPPRPNFPKASVQMYLVCLSATLRSKESLYLDDHRIGVRTSLLVTPESHIVCSKQMLLWARNRYACCDLSATSGVDQLGTLLYTGTQDQRRRALQISGDPTCLPLLQPQRDLTVTRGEELFQEVINHVEVRILNGLFLWGECGIGVLELTAWDGLRVVWMAERLAKEVEPWDRIAVQLEHLETDVWTRLTRMEDWWSIWFRNNRWCIMAKVIMKL